MHCRSVGPENVADLVRLRQEVPQASWIITADDVSPVARSAMLRAGITDVLKVPYNPFDLITLGERSHVAREPIMNGRVREVVDLRVDLDAYSAFKGGQRVHLTRLELRLLYCLCVHYPAVAPTERLLSFGWAGLDEPEGHRLKTHVSRIRRRLDEAGGLPLSILARPSYGYELSPGATRSRASLPASRDAGSRSEGKGQHSRSSGDERLAG